MIRLGLDQEQIARLRKLAKEIVHGVAPIIKRNTTVSVERAIVRLMGLDGIDNDGVPLPNVVVEAVRPRLGDGVARHVAAAMLSTGMDINQLGTAVANREVDILSFPEPPEDELEDFWTEQTSFTMERIAERVKERNEYMKEYPPGPQPWKYVIVATGNIYEDVTQARAPALKGADIIAVIRSTGQSLLDFVPYGATTEGFGGTYATQENFRIMRRALDEVMKETGRYIRLVNYASGLCMPEIVVMGAFERLDMMLNDSMYGILFRDINPVRTFIDQFFSRMIDAVADIIINTGEDNYLTTSDAVEAAHTVLASDLINEAFGLAAGLKPQHLGLGHAFEMNPDIEDGFLMELAQALMLREIFPDHPLKYMPPTKHMTGNVFKGYIMNALFNLVGVWSHQGIQLLGMLTEALHTPYLHDRFLALQNAGYVFNNARHISDAFLVNPDGPIMDRVRTVMDDTEEFLKKVNDSGLLDAISNGWFADISRSPEGGKGLDGVSEKSPAYINPYIRSFAAYLGREEELEKWM